jgi:hypothetical protein
VSGHARSKNRTLFSKKIRLDLYFSLLLEEKKTTPPLLVASDAAAAKDTPPFVKGRYWNYEEDR